MDRVFLSRNGKTCWSIVLGKDLTPSERFAADELQTHFAAICGASLRVKENKSPVTDYEICIGVGKHTIGYEDVCKLSDFAEEELTVFISEKRIILAGHPVRGTLYAVYEFLEQDLGIRWYSPDCTHVPSRGTIAIRERTYNFRPALEYRETLCVHNGRCDPVWFVRNRLNRAMYHHLDERLGGGVEWASPKFCHTFHSFVSPDEYYDEHPEYFAYREEQGKRMTGRRAQLCLSNPDVLDIVIRKTKQWLSEHPDANIVSVSQMDATKPQDILYCQCPECKARDEYEGGPAGSILHFVNQVADGIREEFPYASIDTICYAYSAKPPLHEKARPNVILRPCFHGDALDPWHEVGDRLYVWDYVTNFRHYTLPFPNYDAMSEHINDLLRHRVRGIFIQSTYQTAGTDFNELKAYIYAKLLWHPETDVDTVLREFLAAYFECSAPAMEDYIDLLRDRIRKECKQPACFVNLPVFYLDAPLLREADAIFDRAERCANSDIVLSRVRRMRLSLRFVELQYTPKDDPVRPAKVDEYFDDLAELGVDLISERNELPEAKEQMLSFTGLYELSEPIPGEGYAPDQI